MRQQVGSRYAKTIKNTGIDSVVAIGGGKVILAASLLVVSSYATDDDFCYVREILNIYNTCDEHKVD